MELLVQLSLKNSIIAILGEKRIAIFIVFGEREAWEAPAEDAQDLCE